MHTTAGKSRPSMTGKITHPTGISGHLPLVSFVFGLGPRWTPFSQASALASFNAVLHEMGQRLQLGFESESSLSVVLHAPVWRLLPQLLALRNFITCQSFPVSSQYLLTGCGRVFGHPALKKLIVRRFVMLGIRPKPSPQRLRPSFESRAGLFVPSYIRCSGAYMTDIRTTCRRC